MLQVDRPYTKAVDVWAFGVLLHEMITKTQPFLGLEVRDITQRILGGGRPELDAARVPACLVPVITGCWETDPGRRPTFEQLGRALRELPRNGS